MAVRFGAWDVHRRKLGPTLTVSLPQGMIALRREATEVIHEDYMDGIMEVNAKKKANLMYYA